MHENGSEGVAISQHTKHGVSLHMKGIRVLPYVSY
mgnify:FL=1